MSLLRKFLVLFTALGLVFGLAGCAPEKLEMSAVTAVIDVRTAEEFSTGHLEGAVNIDVNASDFEQQIAKLDPAGKYIVYCRSGNRSGQAIKKMTALGFIDLTNAGSLANAASTTGLAVVN